MPTETEQPVNDERLPVRMPFVTRGEKGQTDFGFSSSGLFSVMITNKSDSEVTVYFNGNTESERRVIAPRSGVFLNGVTRAGASDNQPSWEGIASFYF
jgi:hypothetical protein